jgi:hypothetical protein
MHPLVIITPGRIYMDVRVTYGVSCVVRPNMEFNERKFTFKELAFAQSLPRPRGLDRVREWHLEA